MSFELAPLQRALTGRTRVARVVVAEVKGSAPREVGAAMLVWEDGQEGTIGGGALELQAVERARQALAGGESAFVQALPLGPALGQCCGGAVTLLTELFTAQDLQDIEGKTVFARPCGAARPASLALERVLAEARETGARIGPALIDGWMVEPVATPATPLWIYGAGHVGRALVSVITPLPDFVITWVDTSPERFPHAPEGVTILPAARPQLAAVHAPKAAHHLILTYSHALDLELCHALLRHDFASLGLIGSHSKWARFQSRLRALGHSQASIDRIICPIGDKSLGKHPQAIAIGVAQALLHKKNTNREIKEHARNQREHASASHA